METRKEDKKEVKPEGLGTIAKLMKEGKNPMDAMAEKLVSVLFDKKLLLMTARLNTGFAKMIIRNYIINDFYLTYYGKCKAKIELEPIGVPPYYRKKEIRYLMPIDENTFRNMMLNLNEKLLMITVADKGLGREEVVTIIKGLFGDIRKERELLGIKY